VASIKTKQKLINGVNQLRLNNRVEIVAISNENYNENVTKASVKYKQFFFG